MKFMKNIQKKYSTNTRASFRMFPALFVGLLLLVMTFMVGCTGYTVAPPLDKDASGTPITPVEESTVDILIPALPTAVPAKLPVVAVKATIKPLDAAESVVIYSDIVVTFSQAMNPRTITQETFKVKNDYGNPIEGTVTSDLTNKIWTFTPKTSLDHSTVYTVTITTGAKDLSGNALPMEFVWTFTTDYKKSHSSGGGGSSGGSAPAPAGDTTAPTISSTDPANVAMGVAVNTNVVADFSEAMLESTISDVTFTLKQGATPIAGDVSYTGLTATFNPTDDLEAGTTYTATVTTGAKDLASNPIAADYAWSFTTAPLAGPIGPAAVNLGTARDFVILSKSGISTTGTTLIVGDIGVSPAAATLITGFGLIMDASNTFATSSLVTGKVYAADYTPPTPTKMTTAVSDMETAYTDAAGRTLPDYTELGTGNIGGMTLTPGLYKWGTGVTIPTDVTLSGSSTDVWIFQIGEDLTVNSGAKILLSGGAQAKNIFWQVAGQTTLETTSVFNGNILCYTAIVLKNGATLNGRALAQTAVTLDANPVTIST